MKHFLIFFAVLALPGLMLGQTYTPPTVVPPSPQAQAFVKYVDYPMDYSRGLANTTIPLYTVTSGKISLPLSLSYHADGLQPSAESGTIGLNWTFNFGGMISRSVKGGKDRTPGTIVKTESSISTIPGVHDEDPDFQYFVNASYGINDNEYDIFSYVHPNQSGKFILPKTGNAADFLNPITIPYRPVKITPNSTLDYFDVLDEKGTLYRYGKSLKIAKDETESNAFPSSTYDSKAGKYTWLLTDIVSPDKNDTITLSYNEVDVLNIYPNYVTKLKRIHFHSATDDLPYDNGLTSGPPASINGYMYTTKILKTITFKQGRVVFTYQSEVYPNQFLNKIEVYDKSSSTPVKTINLTRSQYHSYSNRLNWYKLDKVEFFDSQATPVSVNKYLFSYNTSTSFPLINDATTNETYSVDYWGYYNGATNTDMVPPTSLPLFCSSMLGMQGTANRQPNATYTQAGILQTITYPEGGTTTFEYEQNLGTGSVNLGGLRVKKITLQDNLGRSVVKSFAYSDPKYIPIEDNFFWSKNLLTAEFSSSPGCIMETFTVSSEANVDFNIYGSPVVYGKVTEYSGTTASNNGWTEHYYDHNYMYGALNQDFNPYYTSQFVGYLLTNLNWNLGDKYLSMIKYGEPFEKETKTFDVSGNCKEDIVRYYSHNVANTYNNLATKQTIFSHDMGMYCYHPINKVGCFDIYTYAIAQLKQQLDSVKTLTYESNGINYSYVTDTYLYNDRLLVKEAARKNSDGLIRKTTTRYPSDIGYMYYNNPYYTDMTDKNMIAYPIEQYASENGNVVNGTLTLYKSNSSTFVPDMVYSLETVSSITNFVPYTDAGVKDTRYSATPEVTFNTYNTKGNIQQTTGRDGIVTSYLWDASGNYLMAQVKGAAYTTISAQDNKAATYDSKTLWTSLNTLAPNALVTTFTWKPLVGITLQTDPTGTTSRYEYDTFGRLKLVKNDDSYITNRYKYNYKP